MAFNDGFCQLVDSGRSAPALLEAGYYTEHHKLIAGGLIVHGRPEAVLGYAYDYDKHWRFQVDYQSGKETSLRLGLRGASTTSFK